MSVNDGSKLQKQVFKILFEILDCRCLRSICEVPCQFGVWIASNSKADFSVGLEDLWLWMKLWLEPVKQG